MYQIDEETGSIKLTRGDTLKFKVKAFDEYDDPVELTENDKVVFTVKRKITDDLPVIQKTGAYVVVEHADTKDLPFGGYFYDIQVTFANNEKYTIVAPTEDAMKKPEPNFTLTAEVNFE